MEDLADEFREDFLGAVKVLEEFSATDLALREVLSQVRSKVEAQKYADAPNFWEDLRDSLGVVVKNREEKAQKNKAQQVMKQIARLEVKFWAKESTSMLSDLDAEFRLERLVDWIETFEATESGDVSAGPAVLYTVLNDISLQKDMETAQKEALQKAIKESLHKFPYEMQAVLERVGSVQSGGVTARIVNDWRRRNQPSVQDQPVSSSLTFLEQQVLQAAEKARAGDEIGSSAGKEDIDGVPLGQPVPKGSTGEVAGPQSDPNEAGGHQELRGDEDEEEFATAEPFNVKDVPPETMERARTTIIAMLESNAGECPRPFVRNILKQLGIARCPIAALGDKIFFSGAEVFLRRAGTPSPSPALPPPNRSPVPEEVKQQMATIIQEAEGRLPLLHLQEKLLWHPGSVRHEMHGPLRRAVPQVPELFFEPNKVFLVEAARRNVAVLAPPEEDIEGELVEGEPAAEAPVAAPYVADPFAELLATVLAWLEQGGGVLDADVVVKLIKELGFKPKAVIAALSREVFWSHSEAECEILLRTAGGAAQHPKPLPDVYLHEIVHKDIIFRVREMGHKARIDKLAGGLGWNMKSELRKSYGMLRTVIQGLREVFFDPQRLYLKRSLDGVVEWPVNRDGRIGPQAGDPLRHWTPAADDQKAAGDPEWLNVKRQLLGTIMGHSGHCEVAALRQLLSGYDEGSVQLEALFEPGSTRNLGELLFWSRDRVCRRRKEAAEAAKPQMDDQVSIDVRRVLVNTVRSKGLASLSELRVALDEAKLSVKLDDSQLANAAQRIHELFFMPEVVFLRHSLRDIIDESPAEEPSTELSEESIAAKAAERAARLAADDSEDVAMQAIMEAAAALPDEQPAVTPANTESEDGAATGKGFFSFVDTSFQQQPVGNAPKKRRLDDVDPTSSPAAWNAELPLWATEGAAVTVRREQDTGVDEVGAILSMTGTVALVRLISSASGGGMAGTGLGKERSLPTSMLIPVAPQVGASVKVVSGNRNGCFGSLVGLAGQNGVVQIGTLNYETLPMSHLVVLASWR